MMFLISRVLALLFPFNNHTIKYERESNSMKQIIEKVMIKGAEFQIIQKPKTMYAGCQAKADNEKEESNVNTFGLFQAGYKNIKNSLTPDFKHI